MHSSYGSIPVYMLIFITFWIRRRRTLLVAEASWRQFPGMLSWFFSGNDSRPIQGKEHFFFTFTLSCIVLFFFGTSIWLFDDSACSQVHMLNNEKWECEAMASRGVRPATHAGTTAVHQGMRHKLQQMPKKAAKPSVGLYIVVKVFTCLSNPSKVSVLHMSYCGYCLLGIWPYADYGEDNLLFMWKCLTGNMVLIGLILENSVHINVISDLFHFYFIFSFFPRFMLSLDIV